MARRNGETEPLSLDTSHSGRSFTQRVVSSVASRKFSGSRRNSSFRDKTVNLRDVGDISDLLKKGMLFRSSQAVSPTELSPLNFKAVIDLRQKPAHCNKSENKYVRSLQNLANVPGRVVPEQIKPASVRQQPIACAKHSEESVNEYGCDLRVFHVDTVNRSVSWTIFYAMPRTIKYQVLKAVCLCTPPEKVMAPAVASESYFGYPKLYQTLLDSAKSEWAKAMRVLTHESNFPALVHCIHGKDRTGLLVMLVCSLCGIDKEVILDDYVKSEDLLRAGRQDGTLDLPEYLSMDDVIAAKQHVMAGTMDYLIANYGSVVGYLEDIGLTNLELAHIRVNLLVTPPPEDLELLDELNVKHDQFPGLVLDPRKLLKKITSMGSRHFDSGADSGEPKLQRLSGVAEGTSPNSPDKTSAIDLAVSNQSSQEPPPQSAASTSPQPTAHSPSAQPT